MMQQNLGRRTGHDRLLKHPDPQLQHKATGPFCTHYITKMLLSTISYSYYNCVQRTLNLTFLKQGNLDQGWLQANHLPEPSWLGKAFLDGPVWLSAHGHPAMSCGFSVPKEVVFSEQRHLGEKQICQEAELPTTHSLWRHEEKEGIKDCWAQWLPRRVWARRDQHRWLIYEQQGDQGDTPEMQSLIC